MNNSPAVQAVTDVGEPVHRARYMMATRAIHPHLGDISRDTPHLALIYAETAVGDYIGEWVTGIGAVNVRFPRATTRALTAEERARYDGKVVAVGGTVRPLKIEAGGQ